jgi:hypothetical protein
MSSDWMSEHKETNATRGGASMVGCLCCLQGERKRCRLVVVTWRFPKSSDSIRELKERNSNRGGCFCCL